TSDGRILLGVTPYGKFGPDSGGVRGYDFKARVFLRLLGDCGDGVQQAHEACDDGNVDAGDCCTPSCDFAPTGAACDVDGDLCTTDVCDGAGACTAGPAEPRDDCDASLVPGGS